MTKKKPFFRNKENVLSELQKQHCHWDHNAIITNPVKGDVSYGDGVLQPSSLSFDTKIIILIENPFFHWRQKYLFYSSLFFCPDDFGYCNRKKE
ncbi:hypothetical protein CEXT_2131 [Caerostris extrusa]|uniref:Uncharacterized protein n=1 Tax=Caerostris extrusa TaxID=172846 RepID=A0AAV4UZB5_CAEEX|nr:hypothetical protein CEXT_2131 [Caerostris extrusa]